MKETMTISEFIPNAIRTESVVDSIQFNYEQFWHVMDAAMAVGELMDLVKKGVFYNKRIDLDQWTMLLDHVSTAIHGAREVPGANVFAKDVGIENTRLFHAAVGMFTEATEMLQAIDTATKNGEPVDAVNFGEETFDTSWYQAIAWDELSINPEVGFSTVIEKLRARYPDKFTSDKAITRDLATERAILEKGFVKS